MTANEKPGFEGWAILELMGHRRLGGHVRVQELAGAPFFRIDVPTLDEDEHDDYGRSGGGDVS